MAGDDAAAVMGVIEDAEANRPASPIAWMNAAMQRLAQPAPGRPEPTLRRSRSQRLMDDLGLAEEHDHLFREPPGGLLQ